MTSMEISMEKVRSQRRLFYAHMHAHELIATILITAQSSHYLLVYINDKIWTRFRTSANIRMM